MVVLWWDYSDIIKQRSEKKVQEQLGIVYVGL